MNPDSKSTALANEAWGCMVAKSLVDLGIGTVVFSPGSRSTPLVLGCENQVGLETIVENQAGFDLWRTADGENWIPVERQGFSNPYNYGIRNLISTPYGLFIGTTNPFGPKVALRVEEKWQYVDNPAGGLEVWLGDHTKSSYS